MKANCHICKTDFSQEIDKKFEKFEVGRVICKKCGSKQKRYISEADLLLYLTIVELIYIVITVLVGYGFDYFNWWLCILIMAILIGSYFLQKTVSRYIYNNAPFKKNIKDNELNEDAAKVKKNINIQFSIFILLAFGSILFKEYRIDLYGLLAIDIIVSLLRFILAVRKEKE